jgi:hypothetical protein
MLRPKLFLALTIEAQRNAILNPCRQAQLLSHLINALR